MAGSVPHPPKSVVALATATSHADPTDTYYDSGQGGWVRKMGGWVKEDGSIFSTIEGVIRQNTGNPLTKE